MVKVLPKERIVDYLAELARSFAVYAPVQRDGLVCFLPVSVGDRVVLDYRTTSMPPKALFLPHSECLLEFRGEGVSVPAEGEKFVVFMNQVDAQAVAILDEVFGGRFKDSHYLKRRENSIVVAVKSGVEMLNSFSEELDLSYGKGFDALFTDEGGYYSIEGKTAKGRRLLASKLIRNGKAARKKKTRLQPDKLNLKKISSFLDRGPEHEIWHELAGECFTCGICAYVCPVCYCFDVEDATKLEGGGCRMRGWDSCMLADFALVAGGVNFREKRHERIHNWYHHKFSRAVAERGVPDCVGCGRCITYCPAKIKIHDRIRECEK